MSTKHEEEVGICEESDYTLTTFTPQKVLEIGLLVSLLLLFATTLYVIITYCGKFFRQEVLFSMWAISFGVFLHGISSHRQ